MPATMKHVVSVPWTDEERALLRQLWENGLGPVLIGRLHGALQIQRHQADAGAAATATPAAARTGDDAGTPPATGTAAATRRPHAAAATI